MNKSISKARHKARQLVVQALYQLQFNHCTKEEIENQYLEDIYAKNMDVVYFKDLLHGVLQNTAEINQIIQPFLDRPINELTPIESAVLSMATYELKSRLDVPYRVIINEALELTKSFGTSEGYRYVNGVLDKLAKKLRAQEISV
jgi:N utilization substance protein B